MRVNIGEYIDEYNDDWWVEGLYLVDFSGYW